MSYVTFKQPSLGLLDEHGLIRRDLASAPDRPAPHGLKIHINNSHVVERYRERGQYHDPQMDDMTDAELVEQLCERIALAWNRRAKVWDVTGGDGRESLVVEFDHAHENLVAVLSLGRSVRTILTKYMADENYANGAWTVADESRPRPAPAPRLAPRETSELEKLAASVAAADKAVAEARENLAAKDEALRAAKEQLVALATR